MEDRSEGHPFPYNHEDGTFSVPLNALGLIHYAATEIYNTRHNPTLPDRVDPNVPLGIAQVHFEGNGSSSQAILDTVWLHGANFLEACDRGDSLRAVLDLYQQAMLGIGELGMDQD